MSTINDSDIFLVYRGNTTYKVTAANLMSTLQDTDLLLVNRGSTSYKITGADLKSQLGSAIDTANSDSTANWNTYWDSSYASSQQNIAGRREIREAMLDWHSITNVFDGFNDPGSGAIMYGNDNAFWIPPSPISFTSFEIGYSAATHGGMTIQLDFGNDVLFTIRKNTNGTGSHTVDQNDISNLPSSPSIKQIVLSGGSDNYEPHKLISASDSWLSWDYFKINGKFLVDPKALNPAISPT